jgi:hypothetical protein
MDAFCATYADDCVIGDLTGAVAQTGINEIRARYEKTFADFPKNRAWVEARMALGDTVIDHEKGERSPEGPFFEALVIYTIKSGRIARVDFVK